MKQPLYFDRRRFLVLGAGLATAALLPAISASAQAVPAAQGSGAVLAVNGSLQDRVGEALLPWRPGMLDIHHIGTGRGNSTLLIAPDATSLMIDAGAIYGPDKHINEELPYDSRRPGEWIARYAQRHLRGAGRSEIDDFLLTHFHRDHMGAYREDLPRSADGRYALSGISDVANNLHIGRYLDRGFPGYDVYPLPHTDADMVNYRAFIAAQAASGAQVERFRAGAPDQLVLRHDRSAFPGFAIRNLAVNGQVWTGQGQQTRELMPTGKRPTENNCSTAIRLEYGRFRYYSGGDLSNDIHTYGAEPWQDVETPVAQAAGPVDVAVANHHAYVDGNGPGVVRALRPRAFILFAWDSAHPAITPLDHMLSQQLYPSPRDIYATDMKAENAIANRRIAEMTSTNGHVVVRVEPGGNRYTIVVVDNHDESDRVNSVHGPYDSKAHEG